MYDVFINAIISRVIALHYGVIICLFQMMFTASSTVVSDKSDNHSVEHMSCSSVVDETAVNSVDAADINNTPCSVCLDKGSGFHYGVFTCEGCKVG